MLMYGLTSASLQLERCGAIRWSAGKDARLASSVPALTTRPASPPHDEQHRVRTPNARRSCGPGTDRTAQPQRLEYILVQAFDLRPYRQHIASTSAIATLTPARSEGDREQANYAAWAA